MEAMTHPEFFEAKRLLLQHDVPVERVYRVYSPGDPEALCDERGVACATILYTTPDGPRAALLCDDEPGFILMRDGWPV